MSCEYVQERLSPLLDQRVSADERGVVLAHLDVCKDCGAYLAFLQDQRSELRNLAKPAMPVNLRQKLQVIASRERARTLTRLTFEARVRHAKDRLHLVFDNMMRPFGLPVASGLLSAIALFAMVAPSLSSAHPAVADRGYWPGSGERSLATDLVTEPELTKMLPTRDGPVIEDPDLNTDSKYQTVLELQISPDGRVWNWDVMQGSLTPELKQMILFSRFQPATVFGQPTWGEVIVLFRHEYRYIIRG